MRCLMIAVWVASALSACKAKETETAPASTSEVVGVEVTTLAPETWRQTIRTFGVIEAAETVTVASEASGKVTGVFFKEGDDIVAGQKLVTFDLAERKMRVQEAEGSLAAAKAKLDEARAGAERREDLFRNKAISKEQLETAKATLLNLEANFEKLIVGRSLARHQLSRSRLSSPVSGKVVSKTVDAGEVAMPGQALAVIHVTDTMRVTTYVTEEEINTIQVGAACAVTTPGVRGRTYRAYVESTADVADPLTGNFAVKLTVENDDGLLRTGMTAVATLEGLAVKDALLVPERAVVDRDRKKVVFLAKENRAVQVTPVLAVISGGATTAAFIPVLHGLSRGDSLIVGGLAGVADGAALKVTRRVPFSEVVPPAALDPENLTNKKDDVGGMDTDAAASEKR